MKQIKTSVWLVFIVMMMFPLSLAAQEKARQAPSIPAVPALFGGTFSLIDHNGWAKTDQDFNGKLLLVSFGYINCPTICPTKLMAISTSLDMLGDLSDQVQPVFITIDPDRDSPEKLRKYLNKIDPRVLGLSGSETEISRVAKAYRAYRLKVITDDRDPENYLVNHTSITFLMDKVGKFQTLFTQTTKPDVMAQVLRRYLGNDFK